MFRIELKKKGFMYVIRDYFIVYYEIIYILFRESYLISYEFFI